MLPGDNNLAEPLELPEVVQQRLLEEIMLAEQQEILNAEEQELPPAIAAAVGGQQNNQAPPRPQRRGPGGLIVRGGPRTRRSRGRRRGRRSTDDAPASLFIIAMMAVFGAFLTYYAYWYLEQALKHERETAIEKYNRVARKWSLAGREEFSEENFEIALAPSEWKEMEDLKNEKKPQVLSYARMHKSVHLTDVEDLFAHDTTHGGGEIEVYKPLVFTKKIEVVKGKNGKDDREAQAVDKSAAGLGTKQQPGEDEKIDPLDKEKLEAEIENNAAEVKEAPLSAPEVKKYNHFEDDFLNLYVKGSTFPPVRISPQIPLEIKHVRPFSEPGGYSQIYTQHHSPSSASSESEEERRKQMKARRPSFHPIPGAASCESEAASGVFQTNLSTGAAATTSTASGTAAAAAAPARSYNPVIHAMQLRNNPALSPNCLQTWRLASVCLLYNPQTHSVGFDTSVEGKKTDPGVLCGEPMYAPVVFIPPSLAASKAAAATTPGGGVNKPAAATTGAKDSASRSMEDLTSKSSFPDLVAETEPGPPALTPPPRQPPPLSTFDGSVYLPTASTREAVVSGHLDPSALLLKQPHRDDGTASNALNLADQQQRAEELLREEQKEVLMNNMLDQTRIRRTLQEVMGNRVAPAGAPLSRVTSADDRPVSGAPAPPTISIENNGVLRPVQMHGSGGSKHEVPTINVISTPSTSAAGAARSTTYGEVFESITVQIRSTEDPFLYLRDATADSMDFGLEARTGFIIGTVLMLTAGCVCALPIVKLFQILNYWASGFFRCFADCWRCLLLLIGVRRARVGPGMLRANQEEEQQEFISIEDLRISEDEGSATGGEGEDVELEAIEGGGGGGEE
ncbi:unnamed protein product [Amoebophrya sp. A120]|nr:unnamed protein product [Amoebophrya sp. A120]|eukprot:GSA120T00022096001.1